MASMETSTPTAHATPMMIVSTEPRRCGTPARLMASRAMNCRRKFMRSLSWPGVSGLPVSLAACQRFGDSEPRSQDGRNPGADQRHEHGTRQPYLDHHRRHRNPEDEPGAKREGEQRQRKPECRGCDADHRRLGENQQE